jgi:hypothetical protein
MFISLLAQRNEPKESAAFHLFAFGEFPALLTKTDASESLTPCGVLRRVVFQFFAVLLGCVEWHF